MQTHHPVNSRPIMGGVRPPSNNSVANALALTFWVVLWGLNGVSTALPFVLVGRALGEPGIWLGVGICAHIIVSLIENHLWRSFDRCSYGEKGAVASEILLVGIFDVLTAALAIYVLLLYLELASPSLPWYAVCTGIAEVIAIGAELMIRLHWRLMRP
jgi:hypothetical protein